MSKHQSRAGRVIWLTVCSVFAAAVASILATLTLPGLEFYVLGQITSSRFCQWTTSTFQSAILPIIVYFAGLLRSFVPWPLIVVLALVIFARSPTALTAVLSIFRIFRRVSLFGADIELNDESRKQIKATAQDVSAAIVAYREQVASAVRQQIEALRLDEDLAGFVETELEPYFGWAKPPSGFRCTFHVQDFVLRDHLMQLLDYSPSGGGSGRSFSVRYGIIGKVWRSESPKLVGNLLAPEYRALNEKEKIALITEEWGMTRAEARKVSARPSYACLVINNPNGEKAGLFYMDSSEPDAFRRIPPGNTTEEGSEVTLTHIRARLNASKLPEKIGKIQEAMKGAYLLISIAESK